MMSLALDAGEQRMSDKEVKVESAETTKVEPLKDAKPASAAGKKPVRKPGYTNPALKAMGINSLRLPSRNWMIFWSVVATGLGGYAYDRYGQNQARKKWMTRVAHFGEQPLDPRLQARKLTVYIAPPPSDYLDESLSVFRRFVKPVLNAGGVDFEIKSENRQGVIRSIVAADVRALRREILDNAEKLAQEQQANRWYNRIKRFFSRSAAVENVAQLEKKLSDDKYTLKNLLGVYYKNELDESKLTSEDSLISDPTANGGVICIGRGAYKEYLHGLHEGLLGPLDKPIQAIDQDVPMEGVEVKEDINEVKSVAASIPEVKSLDSFETKSEADEAKRDVVEEIKEAKEDVKETKEEEETDDEGNKLQKVPPPFIKTSDYPKADFAPELSSFNVKIATPSGISPVFQQPIAVFPVYHLIGFLKTPNRIWRFYNRRELVDEYGRLACAVVEGHRKPFTPSDVDWAKDEEQDWPNKWVQKGKEKGSEWVQDMGVDERVVGKLWVYDSSAVKDE